MSSTNSDRSFSWICPVFYRSGGCAQTELRLNRSTTALQRAMWLLVVALPLLPVVATLVFHYRERVGALCHSMFHRRKMSSFAQRSLERRTHSFVMMNSTHGQPESVLQTFECYSQTQPTCSIGQEKGEFLDSAVSRAAPLQALELGTHCGYSAIRILRLLPASGKLYTVEQDPDTAEVGEEMILVAGFKHSQFQLLVSPSCTAIPQLQSQFGVQSLDLVFMDHDVAEYLPDLWALEEGGLLTKGCIIVVNNTHLPGAKEFLHYIHNSSHYSVCFQALGMQEIRYQATNTTEELTVTLSNQMVT